MRIQIFKDLLGEYRWRLVSRNGKIMADSGEGYKTKWGVQRAVKKFKKHAPKAEVKLIEGDY